MLESTHCRMLEPVRTGTCIHMRWLKTRRYVSLNTPRVFEDSLRVVIPNHLTGKRSLESSFGMLKLTTGTFSDPSGSQDLRFTD